MVLIVRPPECVSHDVVSPHEVLDVFNLEVCQEFQPASQSPSEVLLSKDPVKQVVVSFDQGPCAVGVVLPCAEALLDGKELLIPYCEVVLC